MCWTTVDFLTFWDWVGHSRSTCFFDNRRLFVGCFCCWWLANRGISPLFCRLKYNSSLNFIYRKTNKCPFLKFIGDEEIKTWTSKENSETPGRSSTCHWWLRIYLYVWKKFFCFLRKMISCAQNFIYSYGNSFTASHNIQFP